MLFFVYTTERHLLCMHPSLLLCGGAGGGGVLLRKKLDLKEQARG